MATFGARGARIAGRLYDVAAKGAKTDMAKRVANDLGEWAAGQAAGLIIDPSDNTSKAGYLQMAGARKPGTAIVNFAADFVADRIKQSISSTTNSVPLTTMTPKPPVTSPAQDMNNILRAAGPAPSFNIPNASFRDRVFNLSETIVKPASPLMAHAFDMESVLSQAPQRSLLQSFMQKASDKKEEKPDEAADNNNKENMAKDNELPQQDSSSRHKV